jgi:hypothetical protein
MIVLVLIASWLLVLSLVVGLCASARSGDAEFAPSGTREGRPARAREPVQEIRAGARGLAGAARPAADAALHADSLAA